ncbi:MAG TPA: CsgG/HfaB family protein [Spirochaetota bacterium]|nr:CsgG/HfaB family protein [Spirochaetota bacterium]HOM10847.1 CsgG/HfaB family protein [Spirochaetota bacterium]HPP50718.1 CsgG/HfaB family protein [Spirochaetota bacterium]
MKKLTVLSLFLFIISCTSVDKSVYIKDKQSLQKPIRIAVLTFVDAPKYPGSGVSIADALTNELVQISNWDLVERSQIEKILKEKSLDMTGLTDYQLTDIGKLAKTDYIIVGSVSDYYYDRQFYIVPKTKIAFNARIINTQTGSIVGTLRYNRETNKNAWCGCCLLGWYYLPVLLLTDQNINTDVSKAARDVVRAIEKDISGKRGCCI